MRIDQTVTIEDLRRLARRRLPKSVFDFFDGGADCELTLKRNVDDFDLLSFVPHILIDVSQRDLSARIVGVPARMPVVIAPTGLAVMAWAQADVALARAAHAAGIPFTISAMSGMRIEDIRDGAPEACLWFQLYVRKDRQLVRSLLARAAAVGCEVLVVAADVPVLGQRNRDIYNRFTVPIQVTPRLVWDLIRCPRFTSHILAHGVPTPRNVVEGAETDAVTSLARFTERTMDATLNWDDLSWLRDSWKGRVVLKGLMAPADAVRAVDAGFDALVLSNHGGRQLDSASSTIAMLPAVKAAVGDRIEILIDGGIRRGTDIAKAVALGASAVLVGRATLYGVAAGGEGGARHALRLLSAELDRCLALLGCPTVRGLNRGFLR